MRMCDFLMQFWMWEQTFWSCLNSNNSDHDEQINTLYYFTATVIKNFNLGHYLNLNSVWEDLKLSLLWLRAPRGQEVLQSAGRGGCDVTLRNGEFWETVMCWTEVWRSRSDLWPSHCVTEFKVCRGGGGVSLTGGHVVSRCVHADSLCDVVTVRCCVERCRL